MRAIKLLVVLAFCNINCLSQPTVDSLEGTWKVEGKETYEVWVKQVDGTLSGASYKMKDGEKMISETLVIKNVENRWVYEATVPDQNEGRSITFVLNYEVKDALSFENPEHDFPTRIIYKPESKSKLFVQVLGGDGKGFTFYMNRQ